MNPTDLPPTELVEQLQEYVTDKKGEELDVTEIYEDFGWDRPDEDMSHEESRMHYFPVINAVELLWHTDSGVNPKALDEGLWEVQE